MSNNTEELLYVSTSKEKQNLAHFLRSPFGLGWLFKPMLFKFPTFGFILCNCLCMAGYCFVVANNFATQ